MNLTRSEAIGRCFRNEKFLDQDILKQNILNYEPISPIKDLRNTYTKLYNCVSSLIFENRRLLIIQNYISKDLASLVNKYDFYLQGVPQFILPTDTAINCIQVLPDNNLALGLGNGWLVIYDTQNGTTKSIFNEHKNAIRSMALMGDIIITGSSGLIKVGTYQTLKGNFKSVNMIKIFGGKIITVDIQTMRIWDLQLGKELLIINEPYIQFIDILPNGNIITSADEIKFWTPDGDLISESEKFPMHILLVLDNSDIIVGIIGSGKILKNGIEILNFKERIISLKKLSGNRIAIGLHNQIQIYDFTIIERFYYSGLYPNIIEELPNGDLVSSTIDDQLILFTNEETRILRSKNVENVESLSILKDGRIVSISNEELIIWN